MDIIRRKGLRQSHGSDSSNDATFRPTVNRRNLLKKSATLAAGASVVGLGSVGTVSAAVSDCTGSGNYNYRNGYVWSLPGQDSADNYNCDNNPHYYKVEHASSMLYLGSCQQNNRWIHDFITTAHAEHFTRTYCGDSWNHSAGIGQHRASFDANDSHSNFDVRANEWVKAHPDIDGQGSNPNQWMDWAYTAMTIAVGAVSWKLGGAMALADVYLDFVDSNPSTFYDLTYDWDVGQPNFSLPCASHFIWQDVQSNVGASDSVDFDYIDEAWGRYPNHTQISYNVQFDSHTDPPDGCDSSALSTSTCTNDSLAALGPDVGDVIVNSKDESVEVVDVNHEVVRLSGTEPVEVDPQNLTPGLRAKVDLDGPVQYREFPMRVTKTTIQGKIRE